MKSKPDKDLLGNVLSNHTVHDQSFKSSFNNNPAEKWEIPLVNTNVSLATYTNASSLTN